MAAAGVDTRPTELLRDAHTVEESVEFATPEEGAENFDDYATMGFTLRRHPLALQREQLTQLACGRRTPCAQPPKIGRRCERAAL